MKRRGIRVDKVVNDQSGCAYGEVSYSVILDDMVIATDVLRKLENRHFIKTGEYADLFDLLPEQLGLIPAVARAADILI